MGKFLSGNLMQLQRMRLAFVEALNAQGEFKAALDFDTDALLMRRPTGAVYIIGSEAFNAALAAVAEQVLNYYPVPFKEPPEVPNFAAAIADAHMLGGGIIGGAIEGARPRYSKAEQLAYVEEYLRMLEAWLASDNPSMALRPIPLMKDGMPDITDMTTDRLKALRTRIAEEPDDFRHRLDAR